MYTADSGGKEVWRKGCAEWVEVVDIILAFRRLMELTSEARRVCDKVVVDRGTELGVIVRERGLLENSGGAGGDAISTGALTVNR